MKEDRETRIQRERDRVKEHEAKRAAECIQKEDLIDGAYYDGQCRNATTARWFAKENVFVYWRTKFGDRFTETIKHPADDNGYDLFYPIDKIDEPLNGKEKIDETN